MGSCRVLKLKTSDDQIFLVEASATVLSVTMRNLMISGESEDKDDDDDDDDPVFPLAKITGRTLAKVTEWCREHSKKGGAAGTEALKEFDERFVENIGTEDDLFAVLAAFINLEVKDLMDLCRQKAEDMIKGETRLHPNKSERRSPSPSPPEKRRRRLVKKFQGPSIE